MQPASVLWADSPLREYLQSFAQVQGVAILVDRRVDPGQLLTLTCREEPVLGIIQAAAESSNLQVSVLRNVVYVGPVASAGRLRTVAELCRQEILSTSKAGARKFAAQATMAWDDFASPRDLLLSLAEENGLEIVNLDRVPHDLWAAGDLPSLSLTERLTLLLHQFDLTFRVAADGRRVAIVPISGNVAVVRDYAGGAKPETLAAKWRAACPNCEVRITGDRIYVRGRLEDHETIDAMRTSGSKTGTRVPIKRPSGQPRQQVFTAEVPNRPLGVVLKHFAGQLGLDLEIDHASLKKAGVSLEQLISFRVENATFDELFQAVLTPIGCRHERKGNVLKIWAKP